MISFSLPYPIRVKKIMERSVPMVLKPISMQKANSSISAHMKLDIQRTCCTTARIEHSSCRRGREEGRGPGDPAVRGRT